MTLYYCRRLKEIHGFPYRLQKESHLARKVDYPGFGKAGAPAATASGNGVTVSAQLFLCLSAFVRTYFVSIFHFFICNDHKICAYAQCLFFYFILLPALPFSVYAPDG